MADSTAVTAGFQSLARLRGNFQLRMVDDSALRRFQLFPYWAMSALAVAIYPLALLLRAMFGLPLLLGFWSVFLFWMAFVFRQFFAIGAARRSREIEAEGGKVLFLRGWTILLMAAPLVAGFAGFFQTWLPLH